MIKYIRESDCNFMFSVTQRIKIIKQPYCGYLPNKYFDRISLEDNNQLYLNENISAALVGMAVDYLTRLMLGASVEDAFSISIEGSKCVNEERKARKLLKKIRGLDDKSIIAATKLVGYDVCYRSSIAYFKSIDNINPDENTIYNIRIMVERSKKFFEKYGPIIKSHVTFEGGYTLIVSSGDGDFMTKDTLWDFKVSKNHPTNQHTLQILMYYILGLHSIYPEFKFITNLGFFNPRLNLVYICKVSEIPKKVYREVSLKIIGYQNEDIDLFEYLFSDICVEEVDPKEKIFITLDSKNIELISEATKFQKGFFRCKVCDFKWNASYRQMKQVTFECPWCRQEKYR